MNDFIDSVEHDEEAFVEEFHSRGLSHRLWRHPYFERIRNKCVTEYLRQWALQAGRIDEVFPEILDNMMKNSGIPECDNGCLKENLDDEQGHGDPEQEHFTLFRNVLQALGITEEEYRQTPMAPGTQKIIESLRVASCDSSNPLRILSLMASEELICPHEFQIFLELLRQRTSRPEDLIYFDVHIQADVKHSDDLIRLCYQTARRIGKTLREIFEWQDEDLENNCSFYDDLIDINDDSFTIKMASVAKNHEAVNNRFLDRFARGEASREEVLRYATEFFHFVRNFPAILATLLGNTSNEEEAQQLTRILYDELGNGDSNQRHELLYRIFLRSIGLDPEKIINEPMQKATAEWIETQRRLYGNNNHFLGVGASFGLEQVALRMFQQIIMGLEIYRDRWFPEMNMLYFILHRDLERGHEEATMRIMGIQGNIPDAIRENIQEGLEEVLAGEAFFFRELEGKFDKNRKK